jgi:hypothetical protein
MQNRWELWGHTSATTSSGSSRYELVQIAHMSSKSFGAWSVRLLARNLETVGTSIGNGRDYLRVGFGALRTLLLAVGMM